MIDLDANHLLNLQTLVREGRGQQAHTSLPGGHVTRYRGQGLEPADLRAYCNGDDPRHIDRNATARTGRLQVRGFQAERDRTTLLIADFRPSMLWGTRRTLRSVATAEALCLIGWRTVAEGGRVGVLAVSAGDPVFVAPAPRTRSMVAVIGGLLRAHTTARARASVGDPPLSDTLELANRLAPRGAEIVLASSLDSRGPRFAEALAALDHRAAFSIIRVVDAFETDAPYVGYRFQTLSGHTGVATPPKCLPAEDTLPMRSAYYVAMPPEKQVSIA